MPREGKARVLSPDEFERLLKVTAADRHAIRNAALLYLSFGLGLRVKEIAGLSLSDATDGAGRLREEVNLPRRTTKGGKPRRVYLSHPKVRRALAAWLDERRRGPSVALPGSPLFVSNKGNRFSPNSLQQVFKRLFVRAGFDGASSHSGRRTFATRLIERGVDIKAVSALMGHADISMTARYVEDNPERLKGIAARAL